MILLAAMICLALVFGVFLPLRRSVSGYVAAALLLFLIQAAINTSMGFAGTSLEESLLLFNGSVASYIGYNLQITYRAFALPLFALALPLVFRLHKGRP